MTQNLSVKWAYFGIELDENYFEIAKERVESVQWYCITKLSFKSSYGGN